MSTPENGETESECLQRDIERHDVKVERIVLLHRQEMQKWESIRMGMIKKLYDLKKEEQSN